MILLTWTKRHANGNETDNWVAFESLWEAKERYDYLLERDDTYSAHICSVIESTDYEIKSLMFSEEHDFLNQFHTFEWENRNFGNWFKAKGYNQKQIDAIAYGDKEAS